MIDEYSLKSSVSLQYQDEKNPKKLAKQILLYEFMKKYLTSNEAVFNDMTEITSIFSSKASRLFDSMQNEYDAYSKMQSAIEKNSFENIMAMSESSIRRIYSIYENRVKLQLYDSKCYNMAQFAESRLTVKQDSYLRKVHDGPMNAIIKYYEKHRGSKDSDLCIIDADINSERPGRIIEFNIKGIDSTIVYSDLVRNRIYADKRDVKLDYPNIVIFNV